MSRLRWIVVLLWIAASLATFAWSLVPAGTETRRITLEPVDLTQAVPALGAGTASDPPSSQPMWTPPLTVEDSLPSRLRLGADEHVRLSLAAVEGVDDRLRLMAAAHLRAVGADVEPAAEVSLPLAGTVPVHFGWTVTAREAGLTWFSLSLRLRGVTATGAPIGERLVWARSQALPARGWLRLPAPLARWGGLISALIGMSAACWMAREGRS